MVCWSREQCYDSCMDTKPLYQLDAITVLDLLFGATTTLPTPYPACGVDGTTDALTCDSFAGCP